MHISRKYFSLINKIIVFIFILFIFNNTSFNYYSEIASNSNEKVAYLTFDDGPSKNTPLIFDILKENDIKVTREKVLSLKKENEFVIQTNKNIYQVEAVLVCSGTKNKYLNLKNDIVFIIKK